MSKLQEWFSLIKGETLKRLGAKLSVPAKFNRFPCGCTLGQGGLVNAKQLKAIFAADKVVQCGHCMKQIGEHKSDTIPDKQPQSPKRSAVRRPGWNEKRLGVQPDRLQLAFDIADSHGMAFVPVKSEKE